MPRGRSPIVRVVEPQTVVTPAGDALPRLRDDVRLAMFDAEAVVFDPVTSTTSLIEGFDAVVVDACREQVDRATFIDEVVDSLGIDSEEAVALVDASLDRLGALGIFEGSALPPPCLGCRGAAAGTPPPRGPVGVVRRLVGRRRQRQR